MRGVSLRKINIQHVILNDVRQTFKLCMSIGVKVGPAQKWYDLTDNNILCLQEGMSQMLYL